MSDRRFVNFLYIFADQLQAMRIGCMGGPAHTPHLDALAADGVLFANAYSDSPVCTPFRGCLMTGRYPTETGVRTNEHGPRHDERTLAQVLNRRGYLTSYVGKWHLYGTGNCPVAPEQRCGFHRFLGYQAYNDFWDDVCFYDEQGVEHRFEAHRTAVTADLAIERLREIRDRRFLHMVSFQTPHYPMQPSPAFEARYASVTPARRPNVREPERVHTPTFSPPSERPVAADPNYQRAGRCLDDFLRCYDAMITEFDFHVGRVLRELKRLGLWDRTVVVVTADHGELAGSHGLMNKGQPWEESARVPLIVRAPDGRRGAVESTPVSAGVDILPTFSDFAGMGIPPSVSGESWKPLCLETDGGTHGPVFSEFGDWVLVRDGRWKYVAERGSLIPRHLFDLETDPYEQDDLVAAADQVAQRDHLAAILEAWWQRVSASSPAEATVPA